MFLWKSKKTILKLYHCYPFLSGALLLTGEKDLTCQVTYPFIVCIPLLMQEQGEIYMKFFFLANLSKGEWIHYEEAIPFSLLPHGQMNDNKSCPLTA